MKRRAQAALCVSCVLVAFFVDMRASCAFEAVCSPITGAVDVAAHHFLRDRLVAGVADAQELSRIDIAVHQAQHDCSLGRYIGNPGIVANLMSLLAASWQREGNLNRADQLFQEAYSTLGNADYNLLEKLGVLHDWAILKLVSHEPERAAELAQLRTSEARREYEHGTWSKDSSRPLLIDALKFQAILLEKIGLADEARPAEEEAKRLAAEQKPCEGVCGLKFHKVN